MADCEPISQRLSSSPAFHDADSLQTHGNCSRTLADFPVLICSVPHLDYFRIADQLDTNREHCAVTRDLPQCAIALTATAPPSLGKTVSYFSFAYSVLACLR